MNPELLKRIYDTIDAMHGWCSAEKARAMARIVVETRPEVSIEIGVWGGKSLMVMALAHCHIDHGHCWGIDPWTAEAALEGVEHPDNREWWSKAPYEVVYRDCLRKLIDADVTHRCSIIRDTSEKASRLFVDVDLLHIDGNHTEESSVLDVFTWLPKMKTGGHIFFDDVDWTEGENVTTRRAVGMVEERCDRVLEIGNCVLFRVQ
jgi:methyltransferase family protein